MIGYFTKDLKTGRKVFVNVITKPRNWDNGCEHDNPKCRTMLCIYKNEPCICPPERWIGIQDD